MTGSHAHKVHKRKDSRLQQIGAGTPIILTHDYDPAQAWFPFMAGILLNPSTKRPELPVIDETEWIERRTQVAIPACRYGELPFSFKKGIEQYRLPFGEVRKIDTLECSLLEQADWPGFEYDSNNNLIQLNMPFNDIKSDRFHTYTVIRQ